MPAIGLNPKIQNLGLEFLHTLGRVVPFGTHTGIHWGLYRKI
jgi:hypothetical protein